MDNTIKNIIKRGIHGFYMQETWILGLFFRMIRGHLLLHHIMTNKTSHRGRTISGVAIILGPVLRRAWNMAGTPLPINYARNPDFPGRMIGVTLCFPNRSNKRSDKYHKKGKGRIKIILYSIYHPVNYDEQTSFNEELASFYNTIPRNAELISSQDVNANIVVRSNMFSDLI